MRSQIPVRYPVPASADNAIERPARDGQFTARVGGDDLVDQYVDDWIGDAGAVEGAHAGRGFRREIRAQRVPRGAGEIEALDRDVVVELVDPLAKLHRINHAQRRIDANGRKIFDERHVVRLKGRLVDQE